MMIMNDSSCPIWQGTDYEIVFCIFIIASFTNMSSAFLWEHNEMRPDMTSFENGYRPFTIAFLPFYILYAECEHFREKSFLQVINSGATMVIADE